MDVREDVRAMVTELRSRISTRQQELSRSGLKKGARVQAANEVAAELDPPMTGHDLDSALGTLNRNAQLEMQSAQNGSECVAKSWDECKVATDQVRILALENAYLPKYGLLGMLLGVTSTRIGQIIKKLTEEGFAFKSVESGLRVTQCPQPPEPPKPPEPPTTVIEPDKAQTEPIAESILREIVKVNEMLGELTGMMRALRDAWK